MNIYPSPAPFELVGTDLAEAYDQILAPSFRPESLPSRDEFLNPPGRHQILGMRDVAGELVAVAACSWSYRHQMLLLTYLAVKPGRRSEGHGTRMLIEASEQWSRLHGDDWTLLIELDHPSHHQPHDLHGDPRRRVEFYSRFGIQALPVPYFMPSLADGQPPVPNKILAVVPGRRGFDGAAVAAFLEAEYDLRETPPPAWCAVADQLRTGNLTLLPLASFDQLPVSGPLDTRTVAA